MSHSTKESGQSTSKTSNRADSNELPGLDLPALPPVIFGVPFALGLAAHLLLDVVPMPLSQLMAWTLGAGLILVSLSLVAWAFRAFAHRGEDPHPTEATRMIVTDGPYRFTRNPMYLAMTLMATGIAVAMRSWPILASVPWSLAAIHVLVVRREEAYLSEILGEEYREFTDRVRRYI